MSFREAIPTCPKCGSQATVVRTKHGARSSCCGLWSWEYKPLVDKDTHDARRVAHVAFDPIWKKGHVDRKEAYRRLAQAMGIAAEECHIGQMDFRQAYSVPWAADKIRRDLGIGDSWT